MIGSVFRNRISGVYWRCCGSSCGSLFIQRIGGSGYLIKEFKSIGRIWKMFYKYCPDLVMPLCGILRERNQEE